MVLSLILLLTVQFMVIHAAPLMKGIPTSEEQVNLLLNVQELFEELKTLLEEETNGTETSIINDVEKIVRRAKDHLMLVEELALTKISELSHSEASNSVSIFDVKPEIDRLTRSSIEQLSGCVNGTRKETEETTRRIEEVTARAFNGTGLLIDSLSTCAKKTAFNLLNCYKDVIQHEVLPVKRLMASAIRAHKDGHSEYIRLRNTANDFVDAIVEEHDIKVAYILNKYIVNSKP